MTAVNLNRAVRGPVTAVPIVAGKGVRLVADTENNRWVVEADETVLWENASGTNLRYGATLSESRQNFETIRLLISMQSNEPVGYVDIPMVGINKDSAFTIQPSIPYSHDTGKTYCLNWKIYISATDTSLKSTGAIFWGKSGTDGATAGSWVQGANTDVPIIYKVIGINRIASN